MYRHRYFVVCQLGNDNHSGLDLDRHAHPPDCTAQITAITKTGISPDLQSWRLVSISHTLSTLIILNIRKRYSLYDSPTRRPWSHGLQERLTL